MKVSISILYSSISKTMFNQIEFTYTMSNWYNLSQPNLINVNPT